MLLGGSFFEEGTGAVQPDEWAAEDVLLQAVLLAALPQLLLQQLALDAVPVEGEQPGRLPPLAVELVQLHPAFPPQNALQQLAQLPLLLPTPNSPAQDLPRQAALLGAQLFPQNSALSLPLEK